MKVYLTNYGNYGVWPEDIRAFMNKEDAIKYLYSKFNLDKKQINKLERNMHLDLNSTKHNAQYCNIVVVKWDV